MKKLLFALAAALLIPTWTAGADNTDPAQNPARRKAVAWIKENNRYGVDAQIVTDMTEVIDKAVSAGQNFAMSFGETLLSGGAPAQIVSWDGEFLVIPLTVQQARAMGIESSSVSVSTNNSQKRDPTPPLKVQSVKFDNPDSVDGSKPLTGELTCEIVGTLPNQPAVRVSRMAGGTTQSGFSYPDNLKGSGVVTVKFSVPAVNSDSDKKKYYGPLPVLVDVCTIKQDGGNVDMRVISNTIAKLITVKSPD
jgi:hypothetical protein